MVLRFKSRSISNIKMYLFRGGHLLLLLQVISNYLMGGLVRACTWQHDFNSHGSAWGYSKTSEDGEEVEKWVEANNLTLVHDTKLPSSFNSDRWRRGYNQDIIFVSSNIKQQCKKKVEAPISNSQHRPLTCQINAIIHPENVPMIRRYNFKKANWENFKTQLDTEINKVIPMPDNYAQFINLVKNISRQNIPRGCRIQSHPGSGEGK